MKILNSFCRFLALAGKKHQMSWRLYLISAFGVAVASTAMALTHSIGVPAIGFSIAILYPFAATLLGRPYLKTILITWVSILLYGIFIFWPLPPLVEYCRRVGFGNRLEELFIWEPSWLGPFWVFSRTWLLPIIPAAIGWLFRYLLNKALKRTPKSFADED